MLQPKILTKKLVKTVSQLGENPNICLEYLNGNYYTETYSRTNPRQLLLGKIELAKVFSAP